jgi:hypothetical protein
MGQHYFEPERESDPHALPDLEVFYAGWAEMTPTEDLERGAEPNPPGWYWWSCFPGCLLLSDAEGPFDSEAEALADARIQYAWANDTGDDAGEWSDE